MNLIVAPAAPAGAESVAGFSGAAAEDVVGFAELLAVFALVAALGSAFALADVAPPPLSPQPTTRVAATRGMHSETSGLFNLFIRCLP
jgi:hypothetical protein